MEGGGGLLLFVEFDDIDLSGVYVGDKGVDWGRETCELGDELNPVALVIAYLKSKQKEAVIEVGYADNEIILQLDLLLAWYEIKTREHLDETL